MPMKLLKTENEKKLEVEMVLHAKRYSLALDKTRCTGCGVCMEICPREAIEIRKIPKTEGEKMKHPTVDVNQEKCHYCGMCESICPFGAFTVKVNGEHMISVVDKESFPRLVREIEVDVTKCPFDCVDCEKACPLELIKVSVQKQDGERVADRGSINNGSPAITVDIEKKFCPCCRLCEMKCPVGVIRVRKFFHGTLAINREKCPEGCQDCLDVCPITGALYLSNGKVYVNEQFCVYCGVCKIVCPVEKALELERTHIRHTPVKSGAWNKALEKITSIEAMTKELRVKGSSKAQDSVKKRFQWRQEA